MKLIFILTLFTCLNVAWSAKSDKWEGDIPQVAEDQAKWDKLIDYFNKSGNYYGVLAASFRMILYFDNFDAKRKGFENLIRLIDIGYPHSLLGFFYVGDLDLSDRDDFSQSYNFYKAAINKIKKMHKWSDDFFLRVDKENFPKYLFYQSVDLYKNKKYVESIEVLDQILKLPSQQKDFTFVKKVIRTKARILFERKEYEKSLALYDDFLLKVNPVTPTDWLEKAWNLYYLKRYDRALGALFNLESPAGNKFPSFEKYILRSSIYLNNCRTDYVNTLIDNFEWEFNYSIDGIIKGKRLSKLPQLNELAKNTHSQYKKILSSIQNLKDEYKNKNDFPDEIKSLAIYLYRSELKMLYKYSKLYKEKALNKAAEDLTMLAESLKFLGYSTAREKYNPIAVFIPRVDESESLVEVIDFEKRGFVFKWKQIGDFWRDERNKYFGEIENKCD